MILCQQPTNVIVAAAAAAAAVAVVAAVVECLKYPFASLHTDL